MSSESRQLSSSRNMGLRRDEQVRRWSSHQRDSGPNSEAETARMARAGQRAEEATRRVDCSAAADDAKVAIGSAEGPAPVPYSTGRSVATLAYNNQLFWELRAQSRGFMTAPANGACSRAPSSHLSAADQSELAVLPRGRFIEGKQQVGACAKYRARCIWVLRYLADVPPVPKGRRQLLASSSATTAR